MGSGDRNIWAVTNDGMTRWRYTTPMPVVASAHCTDDAVYIGDRNGTLYKVLDSFCLGGGGGCLFHQSFIRLQTVCNSALCSSIWMDLLRGDSGQMEKSGELLELQEKSLLCLDRWTGTSIALMTPTVPCFGATMHNRRSPALLSYRLLSFSTHHLGFAYGKKSKT